MIMQTETLISEESSGKFQIQPYNEARSLTYKIAETCAEVRSATRLSPLACSSCLRFHSANA